MTATSAVVFDLDDTLHPERAYNLSGLAAVAAAFEDRLGDRQEVTAEMHQLLDSDYRGRIFNTILTRRGLRDDAQLVRQMIDTYYTHRATISLYDDADSALRRLRGKYRLGLITDGPAVMQRAKIDALDLWGRLDGVILTDELGKEFRKPHPRAFEMIAEQFHVAPHECAYVADNVVKDFIAPNALGWTTIRIVRPEGVYRRETPVEGGVPHHTINTLDELDALLR